MAGTLAPVIRHAFFDANGVPASGYKLFAWAAGTSTKQDTFTDSTLGTANANPIILDSYGQAAIFLSATAYKFSLAPPNDTDPPTSALWTVDNVGAVPNSIIQLDTTGTAGEDIAAGEGVYLSDGSGGKTAGKWYKWDATNAYSSMTARLGMAPASITTGAAGSIRLAGQVSGLAGLTEGATYYVDSATPGGLTLTAPAYSCVAGTADSTTTLMLDFHRGQYQFEKPPQFRPPGWSTYGASVGGRIYAAYTNVGNIGAGEDVIFTYTLPAATLNADGMSIKALVWGTTTNNANAKTLRAYFGGTLLSSLSCATSEAGSWVAGFEVIRTGAATQRAYCQLSSGPMNAMTTASSGFHTAPTETLSGAVVVKITGEATADNDLVTSVGIIWLVP